MALIGLISQDPDTASGLETAIASTGHAVRLIDPGRHGGDGCGKADLIIVDLDGDRAGALESVRRLSEEPETALTPMLVAGAPELAGTLADACAYGASGYLRKPFISVEAVPDTERALAASLK